MLKIKRKVVKLRNEKLRSTLVPATFIAIFSIIGVILLFKSFAATPYISLEPELVADNTVNVVTGDNSASNSGYIQFKPGHPDDPLAIPCQPFVTPPSPFGGGLTYTNWDFGVSGITSIKMQADVRDINTASTTALYFQLYDGTASNGQGYYMGVQSGGLMLFSSFGNIDLSNIRTANGSYAYSGTYEGPFLSLRYNMNSLPVGKYVMRVSRAETDGGGTWYNLLAQIRPSDGNTGAETYLGGMRFPTSGTPVMLQNNGGSWTEYFGNNMLPINYFNVVDTVLAANGPSDEPLQIKNVTFYFSPDYPDSDIVLTDWVTFGVQHRAGGFTQRCHSNGRIL